MIKLFMLVDETDIYSSRGPTELCLWDLKDDQVPNLEELERVITHALGKYIGAHTVCSNVTLESGIKITYDTTRSSTSPTESYDTTQ